MDKLLPITALIAIIIFILKELIEIIKNRKKERSRYRKISNLLSYEIEKNYWSFKSLFRLLEDLGKFDKFDEIKFSCVKGINTHYTLRIEDKENFNGLDYTSNYVILPFYNSRFENLLLEVSYLEDNTFNKIQKFYSSLGALEDYRTQVINLFNSTDWIKDKEVQLQGLNVISTYKERYYSVFNEAYMSLTGERLVNHRLD